ncbi:MAG: hypothetical protein CVV64_08430 [Candidatus Wallbacteria bacterium HGW-Wallbacteria-1]|uniref:Flp family type IVb pilin n=1 Tax=Candidatus Wallbacteria bacterium HGW-Wallbacteria-1 TaxID=2013854 RepID=A0A2N1PPX5_9BACT|nr:MAG: hypothetical protein CVV64_08430 [Candidatus Wallbacteria bacterium HGW-Wallbacteria-1]
MIRSHWKVRGQATTEYTLVFGLITFLCIYIMINVGATIKGVFVSISASCDDVRTKAINSAPVPVNSGN